MSNHSTKKSLRNCWQIITRKLPRRRWLRRLVLIFSALLLLAVVGMYGIAQWYIHQDDTPQTFGVSFIPHYAESLGLNAEETMDSLIGIGVKDFRLVSYWNDSEPTRGEYNFERLDWQFKKAEAANARVILTLGLRQPRWPECHMPDWASQLPREEWQPLLLDYMTTVVNRYKDSPALDRYQVENEYFLQGFGTCTDFSRDRLVAEYNLVKKLDPKRDIIVARSNNAQGIPLGDPKPDVFSISVYKRVWDAGVSRRYLEYPFPAWYYAFLAGSQQILLDRDMMLGELQAEAWPPRGEVIPKTSLMEQNKSFNANRFEDRLEYGKATGMRDINLWGAEYWYYRKQVLQDDSLWRIAETAFKEQ